MILFLLFLFSIFNMKKIFSIVSPPTFHLAPRSLFVVLLQYSHISYVLRKPKKRLSSRGGHPQCERDGSFVEK